MQAPSDQRRTLLVVSIYVVQRTLLPYSPMILFLYLLDSLLIMRLLLSNLVLHQILLHDCAGLNHKSRKLSTMKFVSSTTPKIPYTSRKMNIYARFDHPGILILPRSRTPNPISNLQSTDQTASYILILSKLTNNCLQSGWVLSDIFIKTLTWFLNRQQVVITDSQEN